VDLLGRVSGEAEAVLAAFTKTNEIARDLFLRARHNERSAQTWDDVQTTIRLYKQAVFHDSLFVLARAHLAIASASVFQEWSGDSTWIEDAREHVDLCMQHAPELAETHYADARVHTKLFQWQDAEAALFEALRLRPTYRAPRTKLGEIYSFTGRTEEAESLARLSLDLSSELGDKHGEAQSLMLMGDICLDKVDLENAALYCDSAQSLAIEIGSQSLVNETLIQQGLLATDQGDLETAAAKYNEVLEFALQNNELRKLIEMYSSLAILSGWQGYIDDAVDFISKGEEINDKLNNPVMAIALYNSSYNVYSNIMDLEKMKYAAEKELSAARDLNYMHEIIIGLINVSQVCSHQGSFEETRDSLLVALDYCREYGVNSNETVILNDLASAYNALQQNEEALEVQKQALELSKKQGMAVDIAVSAANLGSAQFKMGNLKEAIVYTDEAIYYFKESSLPFYYYMLLENVATLNSLSGNYSEAVANLEESKQGYIDIDYITGALSSRCVLVDTYIRQNNLSYAIIELDSVIMLDVDQNESLRINFMKMRLNYLQEKYNECFENASVLTQSYSGPKANLVWIYSNASEIRAENPTASVETVLSNLDSLRVTDNLLYTCEGYMIAADALQSEDRDEEADSLIQVGIAFADSKGDRRKATADQLER